MKTESDIQRSKSAKTAYNIKYRHDNWESFMVRASRTRARKISKEHTITVDDIIIPTKCPYLNVELTRIAGQGNTPTNASLDRIDNTKGYTPDNIQVISILANTMKNKATKEQLITFAKNILKIHPINRGTQLWKPAVHVNKNNH